MKPLTEIRKGCEDCMYAYDTTNGRMEKQHAILCSKCQALLEQAQEFEKMIKRQKEVFHDEAHDIDGNCTYFMSAISRQELLKEVQGEKELGEIKR